MHEAYRRKANTALGVMVVCGMFFIETAVAEHARPNPMTTMVWTMLGSMAAVSLVAWVWFRRKARQALEAESEGER